MHGTSAAIVTWDRAASAYGALPCVNAANAGRVMSALLLRPCLTGDRATPRSTALGSRGLLRTRGHEILHPVAGDR